MAMLKVKPSAVEHQRQCQKVLQSSPESCEVDAIEGSLLGFTITLWAESWLPESELLFGDVAQVFLVSRVHSEKQRELASCHGNA